jgi:hypothetical protein
MGGENPYIVPKDVFKASDCDRQTGRNRPISAST